MPPTTQERLATSLALLQELQRGGKRVFRSAELSRTHRERLVREGFLQPVIKGWLMSTSPDTRPGDSTPWIASFWEFCARYCEHRFGERCHLSAEQSLLLHAENTHVPAQLILCTPAGNNNPLPLPFDTSLFDLAVRAMPEAADLEPLSAARGLRGFTLVAALVKVSESFFVQHCVDAQLVLAMVDTPALLGRLLDGGHSVVAGRLAGALRRLGRAAEADEILDAMRQAGHDVRERDPFQPAETLTPCRGQTAPIVGRLGAFWQRLRGQVLQEFPAPPGLSSDATGTLNRIDEVYRQDAYHSLSIEGYQVSPELIARVRSGAWSLETHARDQAGRDALAARGYWEAFQLVRESVAVILRGDPSVEEVRKAHARWYRALFAPCVRAGLVQASALAGYRNQPVYLRGSRHVPPRFEAVRDAMPALFACLEQEPEPAVRAVLGHWLFGYLHPYPDGNGRVARFLMNTMLASGGYPWTVIRVEDRNTYMAALEVASLEHDVRPFARLIASQMSVPL